MIITSRVVDATSWGKTLVDSPNVYVVDSTDELPDVIAKLADRAQQVESALKAL